MTHSLLLVKEERGKDIPPLFQLLIHKEVANNLNIEFCHLEDTEQTSTIALRTSDLDIKTITLGSLWLHP